MGGDVADAMADDAIDATITDEINNDAASVKDPYNLSTKELQQQPLYSSSGMTIGCPMGRKRHRTITSQATVHMCVSVLTLVSSSTD